MSRTAVAGLLVAFLAILGAYTALVLTGHASQTGALISAVVTLVGLLGLGGHLEARTRQQNATIAKIDSQTNGVLTQRIQSGAEAAMRQVLTEFGLSSPAELAAVNAAEAALRAAMVPATVPATVPAPAPVVVPAPAPVVEATPPSYS